MRDLIEAHVRHIQSRGFSERTIDDREEVLRRVHAALPFGLERATIEELEDWLAHPGWSAQTQATYYGHIRGFFAWACDPRRPTLDYDPSAALTRPRIPKRTPRPCTDAELAHALANLTDSWRRCVELAAFAGLRCFEIASQRREHITEEHITVHGKGGKVAPVPTHPVIWRSVRDLPPGPVVTTMTGRPASAWYISVEGSRALRAIGLDGVTMHRFRHWLGTSTLRRGGNLRVTQELLRHESITSTAIYTAVADEERRAAIHALPIPTVTR